MPLRRELPASTVYLVMEGAWGLLFYLMATVASVYRIIEADLNGFELVLVGTVLEGTTLIFEVPTGVVADAISRRLSILVGTFLTGLGFLIEGSIPRLIPILLAQVLWGIGYTFISGADVAWITDEIGEDRARRCTCAPLSCLSSRRSSASREASVSPPSRWDCHSRRRVSAPLLSACS